MGAGGSLPAGGDGGIQAGGKVIPPSDHRGAQADSAVKETRVGAEGGQPEGAGGRASEPDCLKEKENVVQQTPSSRLPHSGNKKKPHTFLLWMIHDHSSLTRTV